jgi:superfamily I DNA and RNA helicase
LVIAHALGFGIYSERIVQMLESSEHWEDIGYVVRRGDFTAGSQIQVERPKENSLTIISEKSDFEEIVYSRVYDSLEKEVEAVAASIKSDIADGLRPDDVLVVTVTQNSTSPIWKLHYCEQIFYPIIYIVILSVSGTSQKKAV